MRSYSTPKDYQELREQIEALRSELGRFTSESVVRTICTKWLSSEDSPDRLLKEVGFLSPLRQTYYILGLTYTTTENQGSRALSKRKWKDLASRVATIFEYYTLLFHPNKVGIQPEEWDNLETTFSAFSDFIGKPRITGTIEQYREKVRDYFSPFDAELRELTGISATDALNVYSDMSEQMQKNLDRIQDFFTPMLQEWRAFCDVYDHDGPEAAGRLMEESRERHKGEGQEAMRAMNDHCLVRLSDLQERFPGTADVFWQRLCSVRSLAGRLLPSHGSEPRRDTPLV